MKLVPGLIALLVIHGLAIADTESKYANQWRDLIKNNKVGRAKLLCKNWLSAKNTLAYVQAHRCLAKVESIAAIRIYQRKDGAGERGERPAKRVLEQRLKNVFQHMDVVMKNAPNDLGLYMDRVNLLNTLGRHQEALDYLDETIAIIKKAISLDHWLRVVDKLDKEERYELALKYLSVLDKHYPGDYKIVAKTASVLMSKGDEINAVVYLRKAAAMAPRDPMNYILLARYYELTGKIALAEKNYMRAMNLKSTKAQRCEYGLFLRRFDRKMIEGCKLQRQNCHEDYITGCGTESNK
ncbi:MAG TPA: hypothetical protein ENG78_02280 [Acidiferrobacteraceae bacterium]|nr:hypothetical protein [Acidiferrobacteraceae bacterium]HEX19635.1 hypothetical protein [Acidiferrobacteraceae bacterium]